MDDQAIEDALEMIESDRSALDVRRYSFISHHHPLLCYSAATNKNLYSQNNLPQDILRRTDDYPETLNRTINSIQSSLPFPEPNDPGALTSTQTIITAQEERARSMASVLENLAGHYDNMAGALKESESGETFTDEEWQGMSCYAMAAKIIS